MARRSRILSIFAPTRAKRGWLRAPREKCPGTGVTHRWPGPSALEEQLFKLGSEEFALFLLRLLAERAVNGVQGHRRHHAIAFAVGMQAVIGEIGLQVAGGIDHGGKIIHVD